MHPDGRMAQNVWIQQENGLDQQRAARGDDSEASYPLLDSKKQSDQEEGTDSGRPQGWYEYPYFRVAN